MLRYLTETANEPGWLLSAVIWLCNSLFGVADPTVIRIVAGILIGSLFFYVLRFIAFVAVVMINVISDVFR